MITYTPEEEEQIIQALELLAEKGFPVPPKIFDAWCGACITVPIELSVLRENVLGETLVLMVFRNDHFFRGWHIPGTIMLPGDTEESAVERLKDEEICAEISPPQFIGRHHVFRNTNARGQEASLLFVSFLMSEYKGAGKFFPLSAIPEDTLVHHKNILKIIHDWWKKNNITRPAF